jgi:hypothetical protein
MVIRFCYKDRAQTIIQNINDQLNVDTQTKHRMKLNNHFIHYCKNQKCLYRQAEKSSITLLGSQRRKVFLFEIKRNLDQDD